MSTLAELRLLVTQQAKLDPLHGRYLTLSSHVEKQSHMSRLLETEGALQTRDARLSVLPFVADASSPRVGHGLAVHGSHIRMLKSDFCAKSYCLILEDDAHWLAGRLRRAIGDIFAEHSDEDWDLLVLGTAAVPMDSPWRVVPYDVRAHSFRVNLTAPGCHAYIARDPLRVAAALEKRASGPGRFCIEYLDGPAHSLRIVMPRHNLVWQRTEEKARARRFDWQLLSCGEADVHALAHPAETIDEACRRSRCVLRGDCKARHSLVPKWQGPIPRQKAARAMSHSSVPTWQGPIPRWKAARAMKRSNSTAKAKNGHGSRHSRASAAVARNGTLTCNPLSRVLSARRRCSYGAKSKTRSQSSRQSSAV